MEMMIELSEQQAEKLRSEAQRLGVEPHALAKAAVVDFLNGDLPDAYRAMEEVFRTYKGLLKRLAD